MTPAPSRSLASVFLAGLCATVLSSAPLRAQGPDAAPKVAARPVSSTWRPLFNGKNLDGWTPKIRGYALGENYGKTFRVEDGKLCVRYDGEAYPEFDRRFGHLFYEHGFSHYRLRVEYRFVGDQAAGGPGWALRNSGLMLHGQPPETMGLDQDFPASIEVQLLGGGEKGKRTTMNLCTPGTHVVMDGKLTKRHCTNSKSKTYRGDGWVSVEVEVRGDQFKHYADGELVMEYEGAQLDPKDGDAKKLLAAGRDKMLRHGTISIQSESHPVEFRKIELMELDSGWRDLLAGDGFDKNWHSEGNWKLADGEVHLKPRAGEKGWRRFGSYLWLEGDYADFEFECEYQLQRRGNSGFYFHVGDEKSPVKKGIEVQLYASHEKGVDARLTDHDAGGIIPGIPPTRNAARPAGAWNHLRVVCHGARLRVILNGTLVNDIRLDRKPLKGRPRAGRIGFQDHGLPLGLRKLRIREL